MSPPDMRWLENIVEVDEDKDAAFCWHVLESSRMRRHALVMNRGWKLLLVVYR